MSNVSQLEERMAHALQLASRGRGLVEPNPMVGALLVQGDEIVAEGFHQRFGGPHAEVEAIRNAIDTGGAIDLASCSMVVTLEPCCHTGKTPPCTKAIIDAGIREVFIAMEDPAPHAAGQGIKQLRAAGVAVHVGILEDQARRLNRPFIKRYTTGLPWTIAKWAQTLDGYTATGTGHSQWISNAQSRERVHELRGCVDAILVGIGTALADDPQLTARDVEVRRVARRVVFDPHFKLPEESKLIQSLVGAKQTSAAQHENEAGHMVARTVAPVTVAALGDAFDADMAKSSRFTELGVELFALPNDTVASDMPGDMASVAASDVASGIASEDSITGPDASHVQQTLSRHRLAIEPLLKHLADLHDATNVLIEGGAALVGSMFQENLIDQALAFIAPKLLGDVSGYPVATGRTVERMEQALPLHLDDIERIGDDVLLDYGVGYRVG